jgi:hypothetical protein
MSQVKHYLQAAKKGKLKGQTHVYYFKRQLMVLKLKSKLLEDNDKYILSSETTQRD